MQDDDPKVGMWWVILGGRTPHHELHSRPFNDEDDAKRAYEFARFAINEHHTWACIKAPSGAVENVTHWKGAA